MRKGKDREMEYENCNLTESAVNNKTVKFYIKFFLVASL